ncbi:hypothetical protein FVER53590_29265 [Fusarium verticillioides]|nr:hypothetical protein FVER53590_29265 [Fusarium verticillioides]
MRMSRPRFTVRLIDQCLPDSPALIIAEQNERSQTREAYLLTRHVLLQSIARPIPCLGAVHRQSQAANPSPVCDVALKQRMHRDLIRVKPL